MLEDTERIPIIPEFVSTRVIGDEAFLMNLQNVKTYSLNETASSVWSMIDGEKSIDQIVLEMLDEYDISEEDCKTSVLGIIENFHAETLVSFDDPHDKK